MRETLTENPKHWCLVSVERAALGGAMPALAWAQSALTTHARQRMVLCHPGRQTHENHPEQGTPRTAESGAAGRPSSSRRSTRPQAALTRPCLALGRSSAALPPERASSNTLRVSSRARVSSLTRACGDRWPPHVVTDAHASHLTSKLLDREAKNSTSLSRASRPQERLKRVR